MNTKPLAYVIEDDFDLSTIFTAALRSAGFEVVPVRDGQKALDLLVQRVPDLVTLDLNLPSVGGDSILQYIRTDDDLKQVPVMLTTANPQLARELYEMADLVLNKPLGYGQLRDLAVKFHPDNRNK